MIMSDAWASVFRIVVGTYWLYFASQKWQGVGWMQGVIKSTAQSNPIPGLHEFLNGVVVPNWFVFAGAQAIGETLVAVLLILGLADRKSTRLNSSHRTISYAVFCLKKKKKTN